jgi:hypothetical protein
LQRVAQLQLRIRALDHGDVGIRELHATSAPGNALAKAHCSMKTGAM